MARGPTMKSLEERLDAIRRDLDKALREVEKIKAQEALILDMLREAKGEPKRAPAPRSNVKQAVLEMLEESGSAGLNAAIAVDTAAKRGNFLDRGTVSSLLSRFKNEEVVWYDGSVYRLNKFKSDPAQTVGSIVNFGRVS